MEINKENVKIDRRKSLGEKATVKISIRLTPSMSEWLKKEKISPTGLFIEGCRVLGYKEK